MMPWQRPELAEWAIVGMNHYHVHGERRLFVAMTRETQCITVEGGDGPWIWDDLAKQAKVINDEIELREAMEG